MTCIKERVAWDYYYIEIVKCYLCLALNHQLGSHRYHAETWKLWGACDVCECERRINAFAVQTISHYFRAYSYSLCQVQRLNSENGDLSTRRGNQMLRKGGSPQSSRFDSKVQQWRWRHHRRSQRQLRQWRHRRYQRVSGRSTGGILRGWRERTSEHGGGAVVSIFHG